MILITGVTGFVGNAVLQVFLAQRKSISIALRVENKSYSSLDNVRLTIVGSIDSNTKWENALKNVETVVHCAAHVHNNISNKNLSYCDPYEEINTRGTIRLAEQSVFAGVTRFIYISSIGVNGGFSSSPFTENDIPKPYDKYTRSKYNAELQLLRLARSHKMEVVIIRPPLIYGFNAPGNFNLLVKLVNSGLPLPLKMINSRRSLVSIDNLTNFICLCADHSLSPKAANQIFLVSDAEDIGISELLTKMIRYSGRGGRLFHVPLIIIRVVAFFLRRQNDLEKILFDLQVDNSKARKMLGWNPVDDLDQQLSSIFNRNLHNQGFVTKSTIRFFDIIFSFGGLIILLPVLISIFIILLFDTGSPFFVQTRVGKEKYPFKLIKFRTMAVGTPSVASHLVGVSSVTSIGSFLRRTKLDELPQLFNVLMGDMSLVGPRPGLLNQDELIAARSALNIYHYKPGITGLAQINNIDMSAPERLALTDEIMIGHLTPLNYFKYIFLTLFGGGRGDVVGK